MSPRNNYLNLLVLFYSIHHELILLKETALVGHTHVTQPHVCGLTSSDETSAGGFEGKTRASTAAALNSPVLIRVFNMMQFPFGSFLFLLTGLGLTVAQNCDYRARCSDHIDKIPECTSGESDLASCLHELLNKCHRDKEAERNLEKTNLQKLVLCKNENFIKYFKGNKECWKGMDSCLTPITMAKAEIQSDLNSNKCMILKATVDLCKKSFSAANTCNQMSVQFIDAATEVIGCPQLGNPTPTPNTATRNADFTIKLLLIIFIISITI